VSAGSLSYGDNDIVMNEIYRVLKLQGVFIAIDSLNNNPTLNECSEISVAHTFASVANKNSVFSPIPAPISKTKLPLWL
jgi:ubiquinone/menaquinone biosynthesis C-methylase UbiE